MIPISIAISTPKWANILKYEKLQPTWSILEQWRKRGDWEQYSSRFESEILSKLNPMAVARELIAISNRKTPVLMCWEGPGNPCHRHLVSEWFNSNGILCKELTLR